MSDYVYSYERGEHRTQRVYVRREVNRDGLVCYAVYLDKCNGKSAKRVGAQLSFPDESACEYLIAHKGVFLGRASDRELSKKLRVAR